MVVFDFDHTVVEDNTDIVIRDLVGKEKISDGVKKLFTVSGWIPYMQEILHILHANNITKSQIKATVENIPEVNGLKDLIRKLHKTQKVDIVIISDSNSVFINYWCNFNGMTQYIKKIYTNPAQFIENDVLKIQPYHHQITCDLSSVNLCKGDILEEFVKNEFEQNNVIYSKIFYIGEHYLSIKLNCYAMNSFFFIIPNQVMDITIFAQCFVLVLVIMDWHEKDLPWNEKLMPFPRNWVC